jgi:tripartite-type tricarboxylate transporter receptor subunit TctC
MTLPRRAFLHLAAGAAALPAVSRIARAQAYPSRPVRLISGFPPGGANDLIARLIGQPTRKAALKDACEQLLQGSCRQSHCRPQ